jgi:hypothetical protein
MLKGNINLEYLHISGGGGGGISSSAFISALESLQPSSALKTLWLPPFLTWRHVGKMNQVVSLVKKDYSLADLDRSVSSQDETG